jgi:hypothetical protein
MLIRSEKARQRRIYSDADMDSILALIPNSRLPTAEMVEGVEAFGDVYSALFKDRVKSKDKVKVEDRVEADLPRSIVTQQKAMAAALDKFRKAEERLKLSVVYHLDEQDADRAAAILAELPWLQEALLRAAVPEKHGGLTCGCRRDHSPKTLWMYMAYQHLAELYARAMPDGPDDIRNLKMPSRDVDGIYQGHVIDFYEACIRPLRGSKGDLRLAIGKRFIRAVLQREP